MDKQTPSVRHSSGEVRPRRGLCHHPRESTVIVFFIHDNVYVTSPLKQQRANDVIMHLPSKQQQTSTHNALLITFCYLMFSHLRNLIAMYKN